MSKRSPNEPEQKILTEPDATRVLARAIELDQIRSAGSKVADLRAAASEVGVSPGAFDAALAEVETRGKTPVTKDKRRARRRVRRAVTAAVVAFVIAFFLQSRTRQAAVSSVPMVEQAVVLRCLSADEAAQVIRPVLNLPENSIVSRNGEGSRVLTIRATPEQWQKVRSLLDEQERTGSAACAMRPALPPTPR